jgi:hypothetical protein
MVALLIDSVRCAACVRERRAKIAALDDSLRLLMLMMFLTIARRRSAASSMKWIASQTVDLLLSASMSATVNRADFGCANGASGGRERRAAVIGVTLTRARGGTNGPDLIRAARIAPLSRQAAIDSDPRARSGALA